MSPQPRIAVIAPNILNGYSAQLVASIQAESFEAGVDAVTYVANAARSKGGPEYFYTKLIAGKDAAAVIIISCGINKLIMDGFASAGITPVLVDVRYPGVNCVRSDNEKGAYEAARHLVKSGREKFGMIVGNIEEADTQQERHAGFIKGLEAEGRKFSEELVWLNHDYTYKSGREALRFMVMNDVDAVFCAAGDYVAQGFLSEARKNGVEVPRNISIIGYDDIESSADLELTTVKQPLEEMGKEAIRMAVEAIKNPNTQPMEKVFDCRLVLRETA